MIVPNGLPASRSLDGQRSAYTPEQLRSKLKQLLEAEVLATIRGYDLVAKLYASEWQMLFLRYTEALKEAEYHWRTRNSTNDL